MSLDPQHASVRSNLFGGEGTVTTWSGLPPNAAPFSAAIWCELSPSGRIGAHRQQRDSEILIGVEGSGNIEVGQQRHVLKRGSVVYVPFGESLQIRNQSTTDPLTYVIVKAQGSHA